MTKNLKELVAKNKKYAREEVNLNELLDKFLLHEQIKRPNKFIPAFHPSLISEGIVCQLWWFYYLKDTQDIPEVWKDENLTAMVNGKGIHNEWQHILFKMNMLEGVYKCISCGYEFWANSPKGQCENCRQFFKSWHYVDFKEVPINTGLIRGHADGILNNAGARFLLELKSIKNVDRPNASYGYEKLINKPLDEHFLQTQLYLYGWYDLAKKAPLEEEFAVDDTGKLSTEKLDGPVYDGARVIGVINQGLIEYFAKNSSEKKSFVIKRSLTSIQFLLDEMQLIWKAFLEDRLDELKGIEYNFKSKCKTCPYRSVCGWK